MLASIDNDRSPQFHILEIAGNAIVGGMEKYVYQLVRQLPTHHFKITCLMPYESAFTASIRRLGSSVFITTMDLDPHWRSIQFTTELVRHQHIDLIHAHMPRAHILAGLAGKLTNIPTVATVHGMDVTALELGMSRTTGTHMVLVCQEAYTQALALGMPPEQISLIPNGVDLKTFTPEGDGTGFRKSLDIPPNAPLIGYVGRLAWEKGPDQFIRMAEHVHKQKPEAHFVLVGEGPMQREMADMIHNTNLTGIVHLAGLWENMSEVYPALDIVVQSSRVEGMPFALLEAMACGRPVVAISVGGVAEIVEVGSTGLTSGPGDWFGLGEGVLKLLNAPDMGKQMGVAGRQRVENIFNLQVTINRTAVLFYQLLGQKPPPDGLLPTDWVLDATEPKPITFDPGVVFPPRS